MSDSDVYEFDDKSSLNKVKGNFTHRFYILNSEPHIKYIFKDFEIDEIGFFDNEYCGVSGHHFVIMCRKK